MDGLQIYRKRMIPDETILLKDDIILEQTEDYLITKWQILKPRKDFCRGISMYVFDKGIKVSKMYNHHNELVYWYIDIIEPQWSEDKNTLISLDLLADVIIDPDGKLQVLDLNEVAEAFENGQLSPSLLSACLYRLNNLLCSIHDGSFAILQDKINNVSEQSQK